MSNLSETPSARDALLRAARDVLAEHGHATVSMRAVARRAGLSHAAPTHFFGDRAGLLTAVAVSGFAMLSERLDAAAAGTGNPLATAGHAYVDFAADNPALIDLMFRRSELHPEDPALLTAQRESIGRLVAAVTASRAETHNVDRWVLISWAFVHGLVELSREGVLSPAIGDGTTDPLQLAHALVEEFSSELGQ